ncbi:protein of unknown function [Nitrospina watsonii]|uniref:Uncharacterized protein n=1 Tax=Nitrospina watsonii TaxID=1323948 RepID=A0ABN8W5K6_9BACT|nr:protein of unknown function [Nitrospina watsonii]
MSAIQARSQLRHSPMFVYCPIPLFYPTLEIRTKKLFSMKPGKTLPLGQCGSGSITPHRQI